MSENGFTGALEKLQKSADGSLSLRSTASAVLSWSTQRFEACADEDTENFLNKPGAQWSSQPLLDLCK